MTPRNASRLAWSVLAIALMFSAAAALFLVLGRSAPQPPGTFGFRGFSILFALSFGTLGALIASRRPENPIGWILCAVGVGGGFQELCAQYALYAVIVRDGGPPLGSLAAWVTSWIWVPVVSGIMFVFLLFPDGRPPSRRWWLAAAVGVTGVLLAAFGFAFGAGPVENFSIIQNPFGIPGTRGMAALLGNQIGLSLFGAGIIAAAASLVARFRRAEGEQRQQLKWFAFSACLAGVALMISFAALNSNKAFYGFVSLLVIVAFCGVPAATAVAILRYRLYDIDVVINRTVVFGALAVFITGVYVGIVVGIGRLVGAGGRPNVALSIAATAVVAVAFEPVRERVQRFANRLVYGNRASPYEVMADFSRRVAGTLSDDQVLPQMAMAVATGVGGVAGQVRLILPAGGERVVTWPEGAETETFARTIPISYAEEAVGELSVAKSAGDSLTPAENHLLDDLAGQAGLALRNARLAVELQDRVDQISEQATEIRWSRQRIVAARDAALRQLERDIEDSTQRQLLGIGAKLRIVTETVEREPDAASAMLDELGTETHDALESLRDLARGIFPPLLADKGIVAALNAHINKAAIRATLETPGEIGRFDAGVEAAVYFCCVEAMANAAKHAPGAGILMTITAPNGQVTFTIADDGAGFDPDAVPHRAGLQNMEDRVEALGGKMSILSSPGAGTTVTGTVPEEGAR